MEKIHDYFRKHNIRKKDIPKAFILYQVLGTITTICGYALCYRFKPMQNIVKKNPFKIWFNNFKTGYPNFYQKSHNLIFEKSKTLSESKYFQPIPKFFGLDSHRAMVAIGENFVLDKLLAPITIPLQFWTTVHWLKNKDCKPEHPIRDSYGVYRSKKLISSYLDKKNE